MRGLLDALAPPGDSLGLGSTVVLTTGSGPRDFRVVGLTGAGGVGASFTQDAIFVPTGVLLSQFNLGLHSSLDALQLGHGVSPAAVAAEVHQRLGGSVTTLAPGADTGDPLSQLEPILLLVSLLSVVIGAGVAANTVSLAALERRRDIGLLRAAGASAGQVFRLLTSEGLLLAIAGSVLGVGAGIALGAGLQAAFASASPAHGGSAGEPDRRSARRPGRDLGRSGGRSRARRGRRADADPRGPQPGVGRTPRARSRRDPRSRASAAGTDRPG